MSVDQCNGESMGISDNSKFQMRLPGLCVVVCLGFVRVVSGQVAPTHESVVVTGVAEPTPLEEADRAVRVLELPRAQRALYDSWYSLLQLDPALNLLQRSPGGFIADLSIRQNLNCQCRSITCSSRSVWGLRRI